MIKKLITKIIIANIPSNDMLLDYFGVHSIIYPSRFLSYLHQKYLARLPTILNQNHYSYANCSLSIITIGIVSVDGALAGLLIAAQKNGVRYSELLRLLYFDIVRMTATDPMHTFLLGLVRRETELNLQFLTSTQKQVLISED